MSQPDSIVEAFGDLLPQLAEDELPLLVAMVERLAAQRYRRWADSAEDPVERDGLLACSVREDEIAVFIESFDASSMTRIGELHERFPDLSARYDRIMDGRPRAEQLRIQAEGELGGADFMRRFAAEAEGATAARFESLALCEEANSRFLFRLLEG